MRWELLLVSYVCLVDTLGVLSPGTSSNWRHCLPLGAGYSPLFLFHNNPLSLLSSSPHWGGDSFLASTQTISPHLIGDAYKPPANPSLAQREQNMSKDAFLVSVPLKTTYEVDINKSLRKSLDLNYSGLSKQVIQQTINGIAELNTVRKRACPTTGNQLSRDQAAMELVMRWV
jgi:hypothetical protein